MTIEPFELSPDSIRVLGVLVEKELATPTYYPLSLRALVQGCNQTTSRNPVTSLTESEVAAALDELRRYRLIGLRSGASTRVTKYRHTLKEQGYARADRAVLALLWLRGAQTAGELRTRSDRLCDLGPVEAVVAQLADLAQRNLVKVLPKQAGQKETRYEHMWASKAEVDLQGPPPLEPADDLAQLRQEVAALRARLEALQEAFDAFTSQF